MIRPIGRSGRSGRSTKGPGHPCPHALKIAQEPSGRVDPSRVAQPEIAIRWLEDEFRAQQLDRMLPYVVSLRNQVESVLG